MYNSTFKSKPHRRRIYTEVKAKVVAAVRGTESIQFLTVLLFCIRRIYLKFRMNSSFSSYHHGTIHPLIHIILVQNSYRGKKFNKFFPPNSSDDLCLLFCINSSSMVRPLQQQEITLCQKYLTQLSPFSSLISYTPNRKLISAILSCVPRGSAGNGPCLFCRKWQVFLLAGRFTLFVSHKSSVVY